MDEYYPNVEPKPADLRMQKKKQNKTKHKPPFGWI